VDNVGYDLGRHVFQIVHIPKFDRILSKVYVGAWHWFVQTTDNRLYYSGEPIDNITGHLSEDQSNGRFVECKKGVVQEGMDMALGDAFSVVYIRKPRNDLFGTRFIRALLHGSKRAIIHSDVSFTL
jgi:hypothetical protein